MIVDVASMYVHCSSGITLLCINMLFPYESLKLIFHSAAVFFLFVATSEISAIAIVNHVCSHESAILHHITTSIYHDTMMINDCRTFMAIRQDPCTLPCSSLLHRFPAPMHRFRNAQSRLLCRTPKHRSKVDEGMHFAECLHNVCTGVWRIHLAQSLSVRSYSIACDMSRACMLPCISHSLISLS